MSKKCNACGAELNDTDIFCTNCGAKQEGDAAANENVVENEVKPTENNTNAVNGFAGKVKAVVGKATDAVKNYIEKAKKDPKFLVIGIAGVVVVLVVLILLISLLFSKGQNKAIDRMVDVMYEGKSGKIESLAPDEYWEYVDDKMDVKVKDVVKYFKDDFYDNYMDLFEDECGEDIKTKYKITDEDDMSDKELDNLKEKLKDAYDIPRKSVTKGYEMSVELTLKGDDDDFSVDVDMYVVKIDGKWYALTEDADFYVTTIVGLAALKNSADKVEEGLGDLFN